MSYQPSDPGTIPLWKVLRAVLILPGTVTVLVPSVLLYRGWSMEAWAARAWQIRLTGVIAGSLCLLAGVLLLVETIRLFAAQGRGSLAPWDPTRRLVVAGPYRHVRNPMITGVFCVLAGESLIFQHPPLGIWFLIFLTVNALYLPLIEEPHLVRRFGRPYVEYRKNVPRWVPRWAAWSPGDAANEDNRARKE